MLKVPMKLSAGGNGYSVRIPKALIDCNAIDPSKKYIMIIQEVSAEEYNERRGKYK